MAAPKKSYKDRTDVPLFVYVPDDFKLWLEKEAKSQGTSISGLVRRWAYEKAKQLNKV